MDNYLDQFDSEIFSKDLIAWYQNNKRELPWREDQNPYRIWISEIMLQQTQVTTVIPYFHAFMDFFPTIESLAKADDEKVLKAWEGLGYYSRARNIHTTAKIIVNEFNGIFPVDYNQIISLKGIGSYTAGAISSIAFNKPHPAVDGNVMRVMSRVLGIWDDIALPKTKRIFEEIISEMIPHDNSSSFNQGLMELGALICKPKHQACSVCPLNKHCKAFNEGYDDQLPVKSSKAKQIKIPLVTGLIQDNQGRFLMRKRPERGLLGNMWEFIQVVGIQLNDLTDYLSNHYNIEVSPGSYLGDVKHIFTHRIWTMKVYNASINYGGSLPTHFVFLSLDEIKQVPISTAHKKVFNLLK